MSADNVKVIQTIYEAFGRGDIPAILQRVSSDTEWGFNVSNSVVPWHKTIKGKAVLPSFFDAFMGNVEIKAFVPKSFMAVPNGVVVDLHLEYVVKKTGRLVNENQLQWWSLDNQGLVTGLMHYEDTAQVEAAWGK